MTGEALLWEAQLLSNQDEALVQQFISQVDTIYSEILIALGKPEADLVMLSRQYQQTKAGDYFGSPLGQRVHEALMAATGGTEP